jgi:transposase
VLAWEAGVRKSAETVRLGFVWRRPRPVVGPVGPEYDEKLRAIRRLLAELPPDEAAVFQDEVDVHLNPKSGSCWMPLRRQAEVPTPGNNEKRHLAGSLVWRTGTLIVSPPGRRRNAELFVAHLDDLRRRMRGYRKVHVICDNASFHGSRLVREYLVDWEHRIELHYLPKYAPETNPIERVWWQLHETLTRNHRCQTIDELVADVFAWISSDRCFYNQELATTRRPHKCAPVPRWTYLALDGGFDGSDRAVAPACRAPWCGRMAVKGNKLYGGRLAFLSDPVLSNPRRSRDDETVTAGTSSNGPNGRSAAITDDFDSQRQTLVMLLVSTCLVRDEEFNYGYAYSYINGPRE